MQPSFRTLTVLFVFLLISFGVHADPVCSRKSLAIVKIQNKRIHLELENAIVIDADHAAFVGLDDFGGEVFRAQFEGEILSFLADGQILKTKPGRLKKIISLPLAQAEFLSILCYQIPSGFVETREGESVIWQNPKLKKLRITFSDFSKKQSAGQNLPQQIMIQNNKALFELKWLP